MLAISTLLVLLVLEVVFRLLGYGPLYDVYSKPYQFWSEDALLGWSLEPGARGEFVGPEPFPVEFRVDISINSQGFRGDEITELPRKGHRVVFLGDSMAAAFEVAEESTYSSLVERRLSEGSTTPIQAINAGVRGYGTDQVLLLYQERIRDLQPDVVVYHTTSNDPDDNITLHRMRRPLGKPAFALRPDGSLEPVGQPVPEYPLCSSYRLNSRFEIARADTIPTRALCWFQTSLADHSALFSFAATRIQQYDVLKGLWDLGAPEGVARGPSAPTTRTYAHELTSVLIRRLGDVVHGDGARLVLLGLEPELSPLDLDAFRDEGIAIVRADEVLEPDPDEVLIPNDGHFNELGHQRIAEILAPEIAELLER